MSKTHPSAVQRFIERKYVQHADERQKAMNLKYTTAETTDLAEEISRYMRSGFIRYCPECSSIGPVPAGARDCCPDGSAHEYVPLAIAEQARKGFHVPKPR